jgi:hypothetical protein
MTDEKPITDDERTTGMGLWTDARDMLAAARLVSTDSRLSISNPVFYLAGHGIEETFKAFLRTRGQSLKELRNIGHDLEHALGAAASHGFEVLCPLTVQDKAMIGLVNRYYKAKHFEYRITGAQTLPNPLELISLGERMLESIKGVCEASLGVVRA